MPGILFGFLFQMERKYYITHSWIHLSSARDFDLFCANFELVSTSFEIIWLVYSCVLSFPTQLQKPYYKETEALFLVK